MKGLKTILMLAFAGLLLLSFVVRVNQVRAQDPKTEYQKQLEEYEREKARLEAENKKKAAMMEEQQRINAAKRYYLEGNTNLKKGLPEEALKSYELATQYDNNFALAYHGKGVALTKLRRYDEAIAAYQKSVMIDPLYGDGYLGLARLYKDLNRFDDALTMCLKAIDAYKNTQNSKPKDLSDAYYELGVVYDKRKEFQKSAEAFQQAALLDSTNYRAYNAQGAALQKIDKNEQAIEAFKKAVTINPKFFESYGRMANLYNKLGQYEKALEAAQNSLKAKPNYPLGAFEAGTALKSMGDRKSVV